MLLRDHPLKSRHGVPNWPPLGAWISELEKHTPEKKNRRSQVARSRTPSILLQSLYS